MPDITELLKTELKNRFPWLGTDEYASGADTVEELANWYIELGGEQTSEVTEYDEDDT